MAGGDYGRTRRALAICGVAAAVFAVAAPVAAQSSSQAVDRAQLLRSESGFHEDPYHAITGTDDSHADASPNDPDLGEQAILKRQEYYRAFSVSVATPVFWTSNVALVRTGEEDDVIFAPAASITWAPRITRTLYATFTAGQQQFYYDRFGELDFGSFDARAGLSYTLPRAHDLLLRAEYNFNRLTSSDELEDEFFSNHSLYLSAELPFRFGGAQQVSVGAEANVSIAGEPDDPRRHDLGIYLGYAARLTRSLTLSTVGRVVVREYVEGGRTDVSEVLAVNANYAFTKWLSASATTTLATSDSNQSVFDYDVANLGGALALNFRF